MNYIFSMAFKAIVTGGSISAGKLRFYAEYVTCEV